MGPPETKEPRSGERGECDSRTGLTVPQPTASRQASRIRDARAELADRGFELTLDEPSIIRIANAGFDCRTLPQSLGLAQILVDQHPITVRGALYQGAVRGIYPNTDNAHYRQTCHLLLKLRRAGLIPYSWIADSTRIRDKPSSWSGLADYGETVRDCYRKDFWASQSLNIEIIVEKDAMAGVLAPITREYDVPLNIIRGNVSETFVWSMAEQIKEAEKITKVFYIGDHDPNGLDIERDIRSRLNGFLGGDPDSDGLETEYNRRVAAFGNAAFGNAAVGGESKVCKGDLDRWWVRLAVNGDDFDRDDLLGFPARPTTNRSWQRRLDEYIDEHGDRCVEVDAIPPNEIRQRLKDAIEEHIMDKDAWETLKAVEKLERESIAKVFSNMGRPAA